jgi:sulfate permease, SulP family
MKKTLVSDILAGLTVSFAALSLGAAFGVMSGRGAFAGMIGAAVIPIITSLFGGTRLQASGPTAPMTAITALIVAYAYEHFAGEKVLAEQFITLVLMMSSVFIILMGVLRLGRFIRYVPQVVVLGFMNGIAVLIWVDQLDTLFGWQGHHPLSGGLMPNAELAFGTLAAIYAIPYLLRKMKVPEHARKFFPSIFITILIVTVITSLSHLRVAHVVLGNSVRTIGEFTSLMTAYFPSDPSIFTSEMLLKALPYALQLCLLSYLDSLLTSLVIDKMTREQTAHDKELVAQGLANGIAGIFQGIPGAQATIRSVLLLKEGAQTRLAGVLVGVFTLIGFLVFSEYIVLICSAVFVGVLLKAGADVFDIDFPKAYFRYRWYRSKKRNIQLGIIALTTVITVVVDLNVAVITGTAVFYLGRKLFYFVDAEDDFSQVHLEAEEIGG